MKNNLLLRFLFAFVLLITANHSAFSQASCAGAAPFCTSTGVNFPASTSTTAPAGPNYGCLGSQPNPAWYYLNIATSGNIQINLSNSANVDIDFIIWGPFASQAQMCTDIFNQTAGSGIDCSYSTAANEQVDISNAVAGQWYMLLITNFSGQPTNISAVAGNAPGVDGTTNCAILCTMTGLTATPGACNPATNTYTVNGTISVTNPPTTGTLTITNSCGGSQTLNPPFSTSINYSFANMPANGAGCSVTATFSADPTCTLTQNYTAPPACNAPCAMTNMNVNISACNPANSTYAVTGTLQFTNPPASGTLTIATCGGNSQVLNAPFTSPVAINIPNIPADGTTNCNVTATFSAAPGCTITVGPYTEPVCVCNMDTLNIVINGCDPTTNDYSIDAHLVFTSPPSTGQLIIQNCSGDQVVLNAPFTSPVDVTIAGINSDGGANCSVTAYFTADPACTITSPTFTEPAACGCTALAGNFTNTITGSATTNYLLCFGDQLDIVTNGDSTLPNDLSSYFPTITYDPGLWLLVYSCPPTVFPYGDINTDPCLLGIWDTSNGSWSILNNIGDGSTLYFVPITMYSMVDGIYATSINGSDWCYDLGPVTPVTFLPDVTANGVENCVAGTVTVTVSGGNAAVNGGNFTASNLLPATASFNNTTTTNNGTIVISGLTGGEMYSFDITDNNGCPVTFSGGPFVGPANSTINPAGPYCVSDPAVNLVGNPGGGTWSGTGITNAATGTFDPAAANIGLNTITYTPPGCFNPSTININVNTAFDATITPAGPFCQSNASTFLAAVDPGGTWSATCGACINATTGEFFPTLATPGNNTITYTIGGACGDTQNTVIQVIADAIATINPAGPFCITDPAVNLSAAQTGGTWSGTGITSSANGTFNPATALAGTHIITYNISGVCGDQDTVAIVVVDQLPSTITPVGPFCENDAAVNLVGATSGGTWSATCGTCINAVTGNFSPTNAGPGTWTITYTIAGSCGTTSTLDITVNPLPVVTFTGDTLSGCVPVTTNFVNTTTLPSSSCTWYIDGVAASTNCAGFSNTFNLPGCYDITLQTTSTGGCTASATQTDMVCAYPYPVANFTFGPTDATVLYPTVNFTNTSTGASTYLWNFAGLGTSTQTNPSFTFPDSSASYQVCLTATSANGCVDSTCQYVLIYDEFLIYVPNSFTPDGDGINDIFFPIVSGHDPLSYELMIFNRWGELIFESHSNQVGWDGYHKGMMSKQDVYVWKLKVKKLNDGEKKEFYGHVSLLK
ncbi:MAG: gliding motility-associated C-terminal domain-containing protein [Bacteroidota bacterium]